MPDTTPNAWLTAWRESNFSTRSEMAEALNRTPTALEHGLLCDEERLRRWERGEVRWPHPPYRRALQELTGRTAEQLGFIPPAKQRQRSQAHIALPARLQDAEHKVDPAELARSADISRLNQWITASDTTDEAVSRLARSTSSLAASHTRVAAKRLLPEVIKLHRRTQSLLVGGNHRPRHTRELLRINADLLAHAAVIFGDINFDEAAEEYAAAALLLAQEAGAEESFAWYAQAKTARWQNRYIEAADLARQGYEASSPGPMKTQLAWYEANAAALLGDKIRAREAVNRAEQSADASHDAPSDLSVWSFPRERQALFSLSVATRTGDLDGALRAAELADRAWTAGAPTAPAIWAQIRVGTGVAHLLNGDLDGTAEELAKMLTLDPGMRLATVTRYLADLDRRLTQRRYQDSPLATQLRQQIHEFNAAALTEDADMESA
ncbi:hypothetical protein [Actinomadura livida]|uniref:Tetratricopeptide (TPR) repeat protein n=1 Tax=Actinomadura livida TaxID=79909 RepID=A0A7W7IA43_9ACTN|nr:MULTISPECIES: hypothetical protein [Actinomadura]MBB4772923.1 tetratricopeptide (TPR) repeat protein [Actinomadura catellatispora]GGU13695.1 hypothetical protein GCM10010208_43410 [Actinomadura livida]